MATGVAGAAMLCCMCLTATVAATGGYSNGFDPVSVAAGEKSWGYVDVVQTLAATLRMPVMVVNGAKEGPTFVVTGGTVGCCNTAAPEPPAPDIHIHRRFPSAPCLRMPPPLTTIASVYLAALPAQYPTEYCGVEAAGRLYQQTSPANLAGKLIIVPVVNMQVGRIRGLRRATHTQPKLLRGVGGMRHPSL